MLSYKSKYCIATAFTVVGTLMGHAEARDIDLKSIGYFEFTPMPASLTSEQDTLILSDSPEYVGPVGGVLSAGTVNGNGRIYFYHVNEMPEPHKIAIVLENKNNETAQVQVLRQLKSVATPDYFAAGRDLSRKDLEMPLLANAKPLYTVTIPPRERRLVYTELESTPVPQDALFTGIVDMHTSKPVFTRVMMLPMKLDSVDASHWVNNLPIDEIQLRGTYKGARREMEVRNVYNTTLGGAFVEIGNDREDKFISGIDEMQNGAAVKNRGNYGVSYTLKIRTTGNEPFRLYFNPLGGPYSGSFTVKRQHSWQRGALSGHGESQTYHIGGADGLSSLGEGTILDTRLIGNYMGGDMLTINFIPAGASNLPVRFLLIPEALANPQQRKVISVDVSKEAKEKLGRTIEGVKEIPVGDGKHGTLKEAEERAQMAEQARQAAKQAADEAKAEAKVKAQKDAEEAAAKKRAEEARMQAEKARLKAEKAEADRVAAEAKRAQLEREAAEKAAAKAAAEARKAEELRIARERKAEADRLAAEERRQAETKRAEEARLAAQRQAEEYTRKQAELKQAEEARAAERARLAEEARIAAEKQAKADRIAQEARREAENRLREQRLAEQQAQEAAQKKAEERAQAIRDMAEQQAAAKRRAEIARQRLEAEREAARRAAEARRPRTLEELDDVNRDDVNGDQQDAVSIDELTKPRPTASQNTRPRDQRQGSGQ